MDKDAQVQESEQKYYKLILFVINDGINSKHARENLERLCEKWLPDRYQIRVVDVMEDFQTALDNNILLTPSVVIVNPEPQITIHGDLSDPGKFIEALNLDQLEENDS